MNKHLRPMEILLVEDNPADARLTELALAKDKVKVHLHHVRDGEEAMKFLRQEGGYEGKPRPDLILLDLNLPRKDGREVLREVKTDDALRQIPVVVLTTSQHQEDIVRSYKLAANAYVSKPFNLQQLLDTVQAIEQFWLVAATLPSEVES